ncbi:cell envelope biogenesis protein TolA [Caulobacter sp. S45]|uniref:cell envelope biogenesis protein TolA n=1 Tax=Caulobacter sp. S45 TaxID=1641861 RepID=UPI00131D6D8C|nr:cell envelope biogenesis protein TolA [Caulobacter sp. S45]
MAKSSARKLKVFQAQFGFFDTVVAVPSQAAALRAWGVRQNLFADGQAKPATDPKAVAAALAHPETPLRRAVGTDDAFAVEPTGLPSVPDAPKTPAPKATAKAKSSAAPKPPADRRALDAAEAALRQLDGDRKREEASFRTQQDALDAARDAAQTAYVAGRKAATADVVEARKRYRSAGGED